MVGMGMSVQNDLEAVIRKIRGHKIKNPGTASLIVALIHDINALLPRLILKPNEPKISRHLKIRDMRC